MVGLGGGCLEAVGKAAGVERGGRANAAFEAAQRLREDDAGVAPGAIERAPGDRVEHLGDGGGVAGFGGAVDGFAERGGHVRARVAVGHRVDVDGVDLGRGLAEMAGCGHEEGAEGGTVEEVAGGRWSRQWRALPATVWPLLNPGASMEVLILPRKGH